MKMLNVHDAQDNTCIRGCWAMPTNALGLPVTLSVVRDKCHIGTDRVSYKISAKVGWVAAAWRRWRKAKLLT